MTQRERPNLRARLAQKELLVAPGVFDGISAKIADQMDFEALYMTGYGTVASHLGLPDAGIATYTDMVSRVAVIAGGSKTPLIADGDTGYGGLLNVQYTVRGYEAAGAIAIQLEDQEFPKKCGHMLGRRVVPVEDMVDKIKVATSSRDDGNFLIIARTDAVAVEGLDRAVARAILYRESGADMLFIEAPRERSELSRIGALMGGATPLMANMVEGGKTPILSADELQELGFAIVIFPGAIVCTLAKTAQEFYGSLRSNGTTAPFHARMFDFDALNGLIGTPEMLARGKQYEAASGPKTEKVEET